MYGDTIVLQGKKSEERGVIIEDFANRLSEKRAELMQLREEDRNLALDYQAPLKQGEYFSTV
jgi:ribosomal protein L29